MKLAGQDAAAHSGARLILQQLGMGGAQGAAFTLAQAIQDHVTGVDPDALEWDKLGPAMGVSGLLNGIASAVFSGPEAAGAAGRAPGASWTASASACPAPRPRSWARIAWGRSSTPWPT